MGRVALERLPAPPLAPFPPPAEPEGAEEEAAGTAIDAPGPGGAAVALACASCGAHVAPLAALVSTNFTGRSGPALLVSRVVNVVAGAAEGRVLRSGPHVVRDLVCAGCGALLGWDYLRASSPAEEYKVGKAVLERAHLRRELLAPRASA